MRFLNALFVIALAIAAAFAAGIVWYQAPGALPLRAILALAWIAFALACIVVWQRRKDARALAAFAAPFAALLVWFVAIEPRNDRVWSPEMTRTLTYTRTGDTITLANVRNFDWTGPAVADERWETRSFDLNALKSVDVLSLYWKGPRVAHTYFSFVWTNGEALSLSVEIRKEKGEAYSPIGGFFKAYELSILAGDERDFYGWRVFFPKEDIQLFRTKTDPQQARKLLLELLDNANDLAKTPAFYNTLTENCSTEIWMLTDALGRGKPDDMRMWASGYVPDFLYDLKILDTAHPLAELRDKGHIMPRVRAALANHLEGPAFSNAIRDGIPAMPD